jgi:hypothetical protein
VRVLGRADHSELTVVEGRAPRQPYRRTDSRRGKAGAGGEGDRKKRAPTRGRRQRNEALKGRLRRGACAAHELSTPCQLPASFQTKEARREAGPSARHRR